MSAFAHTPESGDNFPLLRKMSHLAAEGSLPAAGNEGELATPDPGEFTTQWAHAHLAVRGYLNSFLGDRSAVEDCVQEVALLAWKKGPREVTPDAFLGFCLACAKRVAMGEVRKKYRTRLRLLSPEIVSSLADTVATLEQQDTTTPATRIQALQQCLAALEPGPRRLLDLRYSRQDTSALQREAKSTGKSIDSLYKKLERLRTLLRDCVASKSSPQE